MTQVKFNNEKWRVLHQESWVEVAEKDWVVIKYESYINDESTDSEVELIDWFPAPDQIYSLPNEVEFDIKGEGLILNKYHKWEESNKQVAHLKESEPKPCHKCRTTDYASCHSMRCPMRAESHTSKVLDDLSEDVKKEIPAHEAKGFTKNESIEFATWYSGMEREKVFKAYQRWKKEQATIFLNSNGKLKPFKIVPFTEQEERSIWNKNWTDLSGNFVGHDPKEEDVRLIRL